jgi:hypothetical protein
MFACADDAASVIPEPDVGEVHDALAVDLADGLAKDGSNQADSPDGGPGVEVEPERDVASDAAPGDTSDAATEPEGEPGPDVAADLVASDLSSDESAEAIDCPPPSDLSYTCQVEEPASCPGGLCLGGLCLGPVLDPERWATCGDGACAPTRATTPSTATCSSTTWRAPTRG